MTDLSPTQPTAAVAAGTTLPAHTPAAAYHMGQVAALRGVLHLMQQGDSTNAAAALHALLQQSQEALEDCWTRCVRSMAGTAEERRTLEAAGLPTRIQLQTSQGVPVAIWSTSRTDLTDAWGLFRVPLADQAAQGPIGISIPFQPIANLPSGTRLIDLHDARHAAVAAIEQLLAAQVADAARQADGVSERACWQRLQALASWYTEASAMAVEGLPPDHWRDWTIAPVDALVMGDVTEAARRIEQIGRTVVAIKALALRWAATRFRACLDMAEHAHPRDLHAAITQVGVALAALHTAVRQQLDGFNRGCTQAAGMDPDQVDVQVSFAADAHTLPQLALIPRSARVPPAPLRRRKPRA